MRGFGWAFNGRGLISGRAYKRNKKDI